MAAPSASPPASSPVCFSAAATWSTSRTAEKSPTAPPSSAVWNCSGAACWYQNSAGLKAEELVRVREAVELVFPEGNWRDFLRPVLHRRGRECAVGFVLGRDFFPADDQDDAQEQPGLFDAEGGLREELGFARRPDRLLGGGAAEDKSLSAEGDAITVVEGGGPDDAPVIEVGAVGAAQVNHPHLAALLHIDERVPAPNLGAVDGDVIRLASADAQRPVQAELTEFLALEEGFHVGEI